MRLQMNGVSLCYHRQGLLWVFTADGWKLPSFRLITVVHLPGSPSITSVFRCFLRRTFILSILDLHHICGMTLIYNMFWHHGLFFASVETILIDFLWTHENIQSLKESLWSVRPLKFSTPQEIGFCTSSSLLNSGWINIYWLPSRCEPLALGEGRG